MSRASSHTTPRARSPGIAIASEQVVRRLTDLDLDLIPTAGPFARVTAIFRRGADGWFHVHVPQELGHYVAEAVLDTSRGLTPGRTARARMIREIFFPKRMWRPRQELKRRYEVVIVGGGSHGLATAYYLARKHGIKDVCILEKSYIGSGASGRNTTIIRSNYRTPEGAAFYGESVRLYEKPVRDARLQPHVLAARAPDARALRPGDDHDAGARRGEQAPRDQVERDPPRPDPGALPRARPLAATRLPDRRRALSPARRDHPPRRRRLGIRACGGPPRRRDPPGHRGDGLRALGRSHHRGRDVTRARRVRSGRQRDRGLVVARRHGSSGSGCRSRRTSSRPSSPSR